MKGGKIDERDRFRNNNKLDTASLFDFTVNMVFKGYRLFWVVSPEHDTPAGDLQPPHRVYVCSVNSMIHHSIVNATELPSIGMIWAAEEVHEALLECLFVPSTGATS